jgi:hypothetical protein
MNLKEQMGTALQSINEDLRDLKKRQKAAKKAGKPDFKLNDQIENRENQKKFYMATKTEPVRFENGLVVNAKLVKEYLKKVPKKAVVSAELNVDMLTIRFNVFAGSMGRLNLKDLSSRYKGFDLPKGEALFDGIDFTKTSTEVR